MLSNDLNYAIGEYGISVDADGSWQEVTGLLPGAPCSAYSDEEFADELPSLAADGWRPVVGLSGAQGSADSYVMHPSEFLTEGNIEYLAQHSNYGAGYYKTVYVCSADDDAADGYWVVMFCNFAVDCGEYELHYDE